MTVPLWLLWIPTIILLPIMLVVVAIYLAVSGDRCQFDEP